MRSAAVPVTLIVAVMLGAGSAAADDTCAIAGRVVTPDGKPLADAQILLTTDPEPRRPGSFATPEGTPSARRREPARGPDAARRPSSRSGSTSP
jgi:hypothetical protein